VPAPATVELLLGAPVYSSGVQAELVTPTGAVIVKTLASRFAEFPPMKVERAGYGAGSRNFSGHANVARLVIGEAVEVPAIATRVGTDATAQDTVAVLEANLDDLSPQVFGYVMDRLLTEGALDVFGTPVQMKKNRPGMVLTILARPANVEKLTRIIFAETSTLGVRRRDEQRQVLDRRWETVITPWGEVRMKIASLNGTVTNFAPEYEDCRRIAEEKHVPLKNVMQEATQAYLAGEK
jgi:pyridinium-3,5-bisthiocarboxylic acid mononucleotide nickel chelatase